MTKNPSAARFLVTFDDGPHANTASILDQLANNPAQRDIKAMFFVQTRNAERGRSQIGRLLLQREHAEGHVLGLHTGTAGHVSHTSLSQIELNRSLQDGMNDISLITHDRPMFVRPPYWRFNSVTTDGYNQQGLHMMLSDVKAYDGTNWGQHIFRRWSFRSQLRAIRRRTDLSNIPEVDGVMPIVVTFHDTNAYTSRHLTEYLYLLLDESAHVGLPLEKKPFYDNSPEIMRAALRRAVRQTDSVNVEATPAEVS